MANLFDAANAPEGEPREIVVGDFIQWKRSDLVADYPHAEYSAQYIARITGGGSTEIKLDGTEPSGSNYYLFSVDSATSSDFVAGLYHWQLWITQTSSGNKAVVAEGDFTAIPNMDDNQADPRIYAEKILAKIEALLLGKADKDVANYSIAGRSLSSYSFAELEDLRDKYRAEVAVHRNRELVKNGKSNGSTIKVRFK